MKREQLANYIFGFMPILHRKLLRQRPDCLLPRQQINVLNHIFFEPGKAMRFYGEKMSISKPNMTKIVDTLIERGYLIRGQDKRDRRVITLQVVDEGKKIVKKYISSIKAQIVESTSVLSDDEIDELLVSFATIERIFAKLETVNHSGLDKKERKL